MTTTFTRQFAPQGPMTMQAPMQAPIQPQSQSAQQPLSQPTAEGTIHNPVMGGTTNPLQKDAFDELMDQYPMYQHVFKKLGLQSANGVAFAHESKLKRFEGKSMEEIAKEKAVQQLQVQSLMKGGDVILGLRCEYVPNPGAGICICTVYGTAVAYAQNQAM